MKFVENYPFLVTFSNGSTLPKQHSNQYLTRMTKVGTVEENHTESANYMDNGGIPAVEGNGQPGKIITLNDLYLLMVENHRKLDENHRKLEKKLEDTVMETSAELARKIQESNEALLERVTKVEEDQVTIRQDLAKHVEEINSTVKGFNTAVTAQIREEIIEFERRKQRQNNFIIFGMEEKDEQTDAKFVGTLISKLCPGETMKTRISRIGKPGVFPRKARPVLVSMDKLRDKRGVLNAAKSRIRIMPEYSKITLKQDLTRKQREEWQY
ncbi:unnamed protein product, partial [Allacma fusca]